LNALAAALLTTQERGNPVRLTGAKRQKLHVEDMTELTGQLKRENDLMTERMINMNSLRTAVVKSNELVPDNWHPPKSPGAVGGVKQARRGR
jgi:hypothetical protein